MLYMKEVELAARLQHSSSIDELMEVLNDRPEPVEKVPASSQHTVTPAAAPSRTRDTATGEAVCHAPGTSRTPYQHAA